MVQFSGNLDKSKATKYSLNLSINSKRRKWSGERGKYVSSCNTYPSNTTRSLSRKCI